MGKIVVYRVGGIGRKPARGKLAEVVAEATRKDRVSRPGLTEWIVSGGPWSLPETPEAALRAYSEAWHERDCSAGFEVPADSLGRSGEATRSNAESIRIWLRKFDAVVPSGSLRVVCEE